MTWLAKWAKMIQVKRTTSIECSRNKKSSKKVSEAGQSNQEEELQETLAGQKGKKMSENCAKMRENHVGTC